jgi:hypothetical protein
MARAARDMGLESAGEFHRAMVFLETGRMVEYREALDAVQRLVAKLGQPASRFMARGPGEPGAGGGGDSPTRRPWSNRRSGPAAAPCRGTPSSSRGCSGSPCAWRTAGWEPEPTIRRSAAEFPTRPLFGCLLARLLTELGDQDQARSVFEQLAAGRFAGIRVNNDLLLSLSHLAEVAWFLRDVGRAPCTACCFPTAAWSWTPGNRAPAPWTATWAWRR